MYKRQMTVQKILCIAVLAVAGLMFIATIGMSTDLYEILAPCYDPNIKSYFDMATFKTIEVDGWEYVAGARLYYDIQGFNRLAVILALVLIIVSLLSFISGNNKRRKYYVFNYVATAIIAVAFIAISAYILANVISYKNQFLNGVNFDNNEQWNGAALPEGTFSLKYFVTEDSYGKATAAIYSKSTAWLDFNIVACIITMIAAVLYVCNAVWKYLLCRNEEKLLKESSQALAAKGEVA